ncbi:LamG domain-containing protein [Patescibacteria group bacterium]
MKKILIIPIIIIIAIVGVLIFKSQKTQEVESALNFGLVGYWTLDSDDISGTSVFDVSGQGSTVTMMGGGVGGATTSTGGKLKEAVQFDGSNGYLVKTISDYRISDAEGTIAAWTYIDNIGQGSTIFASSNEVSLAWNLRLIFNTSYNAFCFIAVWSLAMDTDGICGNTDIEANKWYHVAVLSNSTSSIYSLYVNGNKEDLTVTNGTNSGRWFMDLPNRDNITIGALKRTAVVSWFPGRIDEVKVWNRALSDEEVREDYRLSRTKYVDAPVRFASSTGDLVYDERLIGYWSLDAVDSAVSTVYDRSGSDLHLTVSSFYNNQPPTSTAGKIGQAIDFDGNNGNGNLRVADNPILDMKTNEISISAWVYPHSYTHSGGGTYPYVLSKPATYDIYRNGQGGTSQLIFRVWTNDTCWSFVGDSVVPLNQWSHIAYTYASSTVAGKGQIFYLNGDFDSSQIATGTIKNTVNTFGIGDNSSVGNRHWDGLIDEVKLWNYELTATEIQAEYESSGTKRNYAQTFPREGLVGYWNMDANDMTSTTLYDKSGNGRHGTNTGFYIYQTPTSTQGKIRQAIDFDGSNGYINIPADSSLDLVNNGDYTISLWLKVADASSGNSRVVVHPKDVGGTGRMMIALDLDDDECAGNNKIYTYLGGEYTCSNYSIEANSDWTHVALVVTENGASDDVQWYVNGEADNSGTVNSETNNNADWVVGAHQDAIPFYFYDGAIDEVMIYNRALSADEVAQVYKYRREFRE